MEEKFRASFSPQAIWQRSGPSDNLIVFYAFAALRPRSRRAGIELKFYLDPEAVSENSSSSVPNEVWKRPLPSLRLRQGLRMSRSHPTDPILLSVRPSVR